MKLSEFNYELPSELVAQEPFKYRDGSRLLVVSGKDGTIEHRKFSDVADYIRKGDALILNDTKVIPARLIGKRATGGKVEVLLLRKSLAPANLIRGRSGCRPDEIAEAPEGSLWQVLIKPWAKLKGQPIYFEDGVKAEVVEDCGESEASPQGDTKLISFNLNGDFLRFLKKHGQVPLPPYIKRGGSVSQGATSQNKRNGPLWSDAQRYQTVYAEKEGAVAAPTAGLHFTKGLIERISAKGAEILNVTLHVGYGTFKPVKCEDIEHHKMHEEYFEIDAKTFKRINEVRQSGGRIFAVGTTSCRVLETIASGLPLNGYTSIYIYPPYEFKLTDCLITNFHLPKTTLLMLASAFAGKDLLFKAYEEAIRKRYRFYSYGDAMLII